MAKIDPGQNIAQLLAEHPETLAVFAAHGFTAESAAQLTAQVGDDLMLGTVLKAKRIHAERFIVALEERIAAAGETILATELPRPGHLNFLGYLVCPLKHQFREGFEAVLQQHWGESVNPPNCYAPMGCGGDDPCENIWQAPTGAAFPDLVMSVGFDNLFKKAFRDRLVATGHFQAAPAQPVPEAFRELVDPLGAYTVYGLFPYVMMIDRLKLGNRPMPRRWEDLLDPLYEGDVTIGGSGDEVNELLLLEAFARGGAAGVRRLARNVKMIWHAAQMAKTAGSGSPDGAAIYILPWFFAKTCPRVGVVEIVWPEDGALVNPMYVLVKKDFPAALQPLRDYVLGPEFGRAIAESFFPSPHPAVVNPLPEGARFKWLGWDYIHNHDLEAELKRVQAIFWEEKRRPG